MSNDTGTGFTSYASTAQDMTWWNLTSLGLPESVLRGIDQAAREEGSEVDPDDYPTNDEP